MYSRRVTPYDFVRFAGLFFACVAGAILGAVDDLRRRRKD